MWLYNHSRTRKKKQLVKYGRRWNTHMVVAHQQKEKIDSLLKRAGHAPGSNGYIKFYQQAVGKVIKKMSPKQMEQAAGMAKEWNNSHPPAEIQAK